MKKVLLLLILITLTGCTKSANSFLTNEQIIEETEKCDEAKMEVKEVWAYTSNGTRAIHKIVCSTKKTKTPEEICIEKGGVPIDSAWRNMMKDCKFKD